MHPLFVTLNRKGMRRPRPIYARAVQTTTLEFAVLGLLAILVLSLSIPLIGMHHHRQISSDFAALAD